jgi:dipeptidyl aminopeptidase/acylaminoacyl peptidase
MAAPFDLSRLEVTGAPVALVEGVMQSVNQPNMVSDSGAAHFSVSNGGALVYATGGIMRDALRELVWVDRSGSRASLPVPPSSYFGPQLAPGDKRAAVFTTPSGNARVWTLDLERGALTALTAADERGHHNVWAPDGERIAFFSQKQHGIFWKNADGTGTPRRVTQAAHIQEPSAWTPDGKVLVFVENGLRSQVDIWAVDVSGSDPQPTAVIQTAHSETHPTFSPDGRWLAYTSDDSGRLEVYVQRYPGPGRRLRVSINGGSSPAWRGDGKELYYLEPHPPTGNRVIAVRLHVDGEEISAGVPRALFEGEFVVMSGRRSYDVTADGKRFLMVRVLEPPPEPPTELILVNNWFRELRQLVPTK